MTTPDASNNFKLSIGDTLKEIYRFLWSAKNSFILLATLPVAMLSLFWVAMAGLAVVTVPGDSANPALWEICVLYVPSLVLFSVFAVTWHRHYLNRGVKSALRTRYSQHPASEVLLQHLAHHAFAVAVISVPIVIVIIFTLVINFAAGGKVKPPVDVQTVSVFVGIVAAVLFSCVFLRLAQWLSVIAIASPFKMLEAGGSGGEILAPVCNRLRRGDHSGDPDRTLSAYADELETCCQYSQKIHGS